MAEPTAPEALPADGAEPCPRCGTPCEPLQEYCLTCGLRLPAPPSGVVASLGTSWRRHLPWYPGDWIWAALALAVVAALGGALAVLAEPGESRSQTLVATTTPGRTTGLAVTTTPPPTAAPTTTVGTTTAPVQTAPPTPPPRRGGKLVVWPEGKSGWTVVLRSLPAGGGRSAAVADAREAIGSGMRDVGVLASSDYSSLHPGYLVVFAGIYDSQSDAEAAAETARSGSYPAAYVRQVSP